MEHVVAALIAWFEGALLAYFLTLNSLYLLFAVIAFCELRRHRRRWSGRDLDVVVRSPATPAISLIVPAYNEEQTIEQSLKALLLLNYPEYEVVVVNDGSTDRTMAAAIAAFDLVRAEAKHERVIETKTVRGIYRSLNHHELIVIDKANGGKADAINAGVNAAKHPLVCVIDADSLLEEHALTRAVLPFLEDPTTVAAGGIVRIVNGCQVTDGRVSSVGLSDSHVARFQVTEYLRAFLAGRVAQSVMNGVLIISGAFGLFRQDALLAVGGFSTDTVGEDMEVIVRLHRYYRERNETYRIVFRPDPVLIAAFASCGADGQWCTDEKVATVEQLHAQVGARVAAGLAVLHAPGNLIGGQGPLDAAWGRRWRGIWTRSSPNRRTSPRLGRCAR